MSLFDLPLYEGLPLGYTVFFVLIGAVIGSFFNVLALRWPAYQIAKNDGEAALWMWLRDSKRQSLKFKSPVEIPSLMSGRSHCPHCKNPIPLYLNIPIVSWLMLRGKSLCCSKPIKFQYLAFELIGAIIFASIAMTVGPSMYGLVLGCALMVLCLAAWIDATEGFIPDGLLFSGLILVYTLAMGPHWINVSQSFAFHMASFFSIMIPFKLISLVRGQDGMGYADFHLIGLCGALLGPKIGWMVIPVIPLLIATFFVYKSGLIKRGLFVSIVGESGVPAGPAIVLSALGITALIVTGML